MTVESRIGILSDAVSIDLLRRLARSRAVLAAVPAGLDDHLSNQFRAEFQLVSDNNASASKGDLARATLLLAAADQEHRPGIEAALDAPLPESFAVVESALLASAVLVVLQTHMRFEKDKEGKWSVLVEKKPTSVELLKNVVSRLLGLR